MMKTHLLSSKKGRGGGSLLFSESQYISLKREEKISTKYSEAVQKFYFWWTNHSEDFVVSHISHTLCSLWSILFFNSYFYDKKQIQFAKPHLQVAHTANWGRQETEVNINVTSWEIFLKKYLNKCFVRSEEHTSELQSRQYLVCRLLLEKKKKYQPTRIFI